MTVQLSAKQLHWQADNKTIVKDVNFSLNSGETLGIVGPNGAGKTSLLKCLYQEYSAASGELFLGNRALKTIDRKAIAQQIAVVAQHHDSVFDLSVFDVVHMGLIPHKALFERDTAADDLLIEHALTKVDLLTKSQQTFKTLSGGEQQRCLIARAIVQRPKVLIMDEPTNHLDVYYQHQILALVKQLGLSNIITIHDLNLAAQYCDRILLMSDGELVAQGHPEQVFSRQLLSQVFKLDCMVDSNPLTNTPRVTFAGVSHGH
ncbi:ABC transporter ATP-binding protein [Thalassotalea ganghwensis]